MKHRCALVFALCFVIGLRSAFAERMTGGGIQFDLKLNQKSGVVTLEIKNLRSKDLDLSVVSLENPMFSGGYSYRQDDKMMNGGFGEWQGGLGRRIKKGGYIVLKSGESLKKEYNINSRLENLKKTMAKKISIDSQAVLDMQIEFLNLIRPAESGDWTVITSGPSFSIRKALELYPESVSATGKADPPTALSEAGSASPTSGKASEH